MSRKTRTPRRRKYSTQETWRTKVTPYFLKMAHEFKRVREIGERKNKPAFEKFLREDWPRILTENRDRLRPAGLALDDCYFKYLCWLKWQEFPEELLLRIAERYDLKAYDELAWVSRAFYKSYWGRLDYKQDLRVKSREPHTYLMIGGLKEGNLSELTAKELADCFDALCPCGEPHSEDALVKMRARILSKVPSQKEFLARIERLMARAQASNRSH